MLLTELQAAEKWCPHTQLLSPVACRCIGAQCMSWRWFDDHVWPAFRKVLGNPEAETEAETEGRPSEIPGRLGVRLLQRHGLRRRLLARARSRHQRKTQGYCGLAGVPHSFMQTRVQADRPRGARLPLTSAKGCSHEPMLEIDR